MVVTVRKINETYEKPPNRVASRHWQKLGCLSTDRIISMDHHNKAIWRLDDMISNKSVMHSCYTYRHEIGIHSFAHYKRRNTQEVADMWMQAVLQCSIENELELLKKALEEYKCMEPEVRKELNKAIEFFDEQKKVIDKKPWYDFENPFASPTFSFTTIDKLLTIVFLIIFTCIIILVLKCYNDIRSGSRTFSNNRGTSERMLPRERDRPKDQQEPIITVKKDHNLPEYESPNNRQEMTITDEQ